MQRASLAASAAVVVWAGLSGWGAPGSGPAIAIPVVRAGSWRVEQTINGNVVPTGDFCMSAKPVVLPPDDEPQCGVATVSRRDDGSLLIERSCTGDGGKRSVDQHAIFRGDPNSQFTLDGRVTAYKRGDLLPMTLSGHGSYRYLGKCAR